MASDHEYWEYVSQLDRDGLQELWQAISNDDTPPGFPYDRYVRGKGFEFLVLRGFELDLAALGERSGKVVWPYQVTQLDLGVGHQANAVEQIDGGVHLPGLSCLFECKCPANDLVGVEPIAKLASKLLRRPAGLIGSVFSATDFEESAVLLSLFLAPLTVLLWYGNDIEWCLANAEDGGFVEALQWKYRQAVDLGQPKVVLSSRISVAKTGEHADRLPQD